uniref:Uncharacterized protein n=1 Tax=Ananas comosus var. bracteatus TaxID=296719 RepID=A0A6V7Q152_ANACO|nr:unnamed protein product [Ananas comosus var. bracteatus]
MNEGAGEELLSLSLGLNSSWCTNTTKMKRKAKDDHEYSNPACNVTTMQDVEDNKFFNLLHMRDQMLKHDPKRSNGALEGTTNGLQLIHLLLFAATAINKNNTSSAVDALHEIYKNASFHGDSIQRVVAYFADALSVRIPSPRSPLYHSIVVSPTPEEEFSAFTEFYRASPYYQFAHFTANQAIVEAFENEEKRNGGRIHVIDFDVSYGFQWPSLIQSLSDKASSSKPISLRITGFGRSVDELEETEMRLVNFASGCNNLFFKFEGILRGSSTCNDIRIEKYSTLVVNLVFYLQKLSSSNEMHDTLATIHSLHPSLVVLIEREGNQSPRSFVSRFMESLHYYAAMFDSLNECLPPESVERLSIEKNHLGREIKCGMDQEDGEGHFKVESLKQRMERVGFEEMKLSSRTVSQAKLLLKIKSHGSTMGCGSNCGDLGFW